jgi:hypothetical protein
MSQRIALIFMMIGLSSVAMANEPVAPAPSNSEAVADINTSKEDTPIYLICKIRTLVRTLRVQKKPQGKCISTYTKNGVDQIVGRSTSIAQCSKVLTNIRENLEKANWKCKDISEARVSSSEE